jgi:NitT/TauT family transport system substrate-binding protein
LEPGPLEATACVKLVDQNQSDMGFPSPGVFSLGLEQGMKLVSAWEMGAFDVFDYAFRKGEAPKDLAGLKGKTIVLGSAGWQAICDPMFASSGIDPASMKYVEAGNSWGQALAQGKADAALCWEGLRAQWKGQGLDFDYLIGRDFSKLPANVFVMRRADFEDASKKDTYIRYLRAWAMGLEFGHLDPRAATHITMQQFPGLASQMKPPVAVESMMQLGNVFRGDFEKRKGWGWHDEAAWALFFKTIKDIGQIHGDIKVADVIKNDYFAGANAFDKAKVTADADGYTLPGEYASIDVEAIRKAL